MKNTLALILAVLALAVALLALLRPAASAEEEVEIAEWMLSMQTHAAKLWFAGENKNWPLALYQLEEIEELMEEIEEHDIMEGGVNLGGLAEAIRGTQVRDLMRAAQAADIKAFTKNYDALLQACNGCHRSSGHPFIQVQRPTAPAFTNQLFAPAREQQE